MGKYYRSMRTRQELAELDDPDLEDWGIKVRAKRNRRNLPTEWVGYLREEKNKKVKYRARDI